MTSHKPRKLTTQQQKILYLLYRFRFLTTSHIQHYLLYKNPRYTQQLLKQLFLMEYVYLFKEDSLIGNTKPYVYCLTSKAARILRNNKECDGVLLSQLYKEKKKSERFRTHCLFLADIYFLIQTQTREKKETLHFLTKSDLLGYDYLPNPLPDGYVSIKKEGIITKRYFLTIIDAQTPWFAINSLVKKYLAYYEEKIWLLSADLPVPAILFICTDQKTLRYLKKSLKTNAYGLPFSDFPCYFTTCGLLMKHKLTDDALQTTSL